MEVKFGYKQTEVGVIPEDWDVVEAFELDPFITSGSRGWAKYYSDRGALFMRMTNLSRESIYPDLSDQKLVDLPQNETEGLRTVLQDGDILISITADIGIIGYINGRIPKPAYINQHIACLRLPPKQTDSLFQSYYLASHEPQRRFAEMTDVGAKTGINLTTIGKLKLLRPPLPEQHAIAQALGDVDALLGGLDRLIAKKRDLKEAAMQQLLTGQTRVPGFDGEWKVKAIGDEIDLLTGFPFPSSKYVESGVRLLRGSNVKRGETDWTEGLVQCWPKISPGIAVYELEAGDLVIAMDGSLVGRSYARLSQTDLPALLLQRVARIRSRAIDIGFLFHFIGSDRFIKYCDSVKTVTAIPHISSADIRKFSIPLPPKAEQTAIAEVLSDMDAELWALEQRQEKTRDLKQAMMQELLTGKTRLV